MNLRGYKLAVRVIESEAIGIYGKYRQSRGAVTVHEHDEGVIGGSSTPQLQ